MMKQDGAPLHACQASVTSELGVEFVMGSLNRERVSMVSGYHEIVIIYGFINLGKHFYAEKDGDFNAYVLMKEKKIF